MEAWTVKPLCTLSYSSPFFRMGLLHTDSFNKYSDAAPRYCTHPVRQRASVNKACKAGWLECTGSKYKHFIASRRKSSTFMRALLSMIAVPAKERTLSKFSSVSLEHPELREERFQMVCVILIHRYGLEKPGLGQLFVHYFKSLQAGIAVLLKSSDDYVSHVHSFSGLHSRVLTVTLQNSRSFFFSPLPHISLESSNHPATPIVYYA